MAEILRMPEIAANTTEALLATWLVEPETPFAAGDPLATIETDKAAVDVAAEADGVLLRVLVPAGTEVEVGTPLAVWGSAQEPDADIEALLASLGVAEPGGTAVAASNGSSPAPAAAPTHAQAPADGGPSRIFSSPLARRLAGEAGLDLAQVVGSGPGGRIRRRDVEAALAARPGTPAAAAPAGAVAPQPISGPNAGFVDEPVSRMRQAIARRLTESKQTAPHFYLRGSARVDRLLAMRAELNEDRSTTISVNDLVVKAVARAHTLVPGMNVQWVEAAAGPATTASIRRFRTVDIAVAVATDDGLVTPVVHDVESLSLTRLAETTRDLAERARARQLTPAELDGGSITVTNLGMLGTEEFAAIINPPQAAILAVGAARQEPVVVQGAVEVGTIMRVTLAVDHRPVDGVLAAEWMRTFLGLLERPLQILV